MSIANEQEPLAVVTWLWGEKFKPEHVNKLYQNFKRNYDKPFNFFVVSDKKYVFEKGIKRKKMPRQLFPKSHHRCYRRLALFNPEYGLQFGKRILQLDLDIVITGNLTEMMSVQDSCKIWLAPSAGPEKRVKNPTVFLFNVEDMKFFYDKLKVHYEKMIAKAREKYRGSDQALLSEYIECPVWTEADGIYGFRENSGIKEGDLPKNAKIISFHGPKRLPENFTNIKWVEENYK